MRSQSRSSAKSPFTTRWWRVADRPDSDRVLIGVIFAPLERLQNGYSDTDGAKPPAVAKLILPTRFFIAAT